MSGYDSDTPVRARVASPGGEAAWSSLPETPVSLARTPPSSQMFDDDTGEALNPAARKLVQEALAADELALEANGGAAPKLQSNWDRCTDTAAPRRYQHEGYVCAYQIQRDFRFSARSIGLHYPAHR